MPFGIGFFAGGADSDYRLIESQILGSNTGTITFTNIPQGFTHLQLRLVARSTLASTTDNVAFQINGNTGTNYVTHDLLGNTVNVTSSAITGQAFGFLPSHLPGSSATTGTFAASIIDFLDYSSTNKNKTIRSLTGFAVNSSYGRVALTSNLFISTSAMTSISMINSATFIAGSRFSLYGIRG